MSFKGRSSFPACPSFVNVTLVPFLVLAVRCSAESHRAWPMSRSSCSTLSAPCSARPSSEDWRDLGPCATLSLPPAASSTSSTPPGFSTEIQSDSISVRNFSTTETENHRLAFKRHQLIIKRHCRSVGVERAPRTLPTRCVPRSSPIRPSACPSFRPRPATARPRALRLATLLRGAGLERCWWCQPGRDTGKRYEVVAKT